jgi:two-component system cell cycle sensor histidine kinase/response regulator CckA
VIEADCAATAMLLLAGKSANVDLLLTASNLPGDTSGAELAGRIRQRSPDLKVIYASSRNPDAVKQSLSAGDDFRFVSKPFKPENLLQAVEATLISRS